MTTTYKGTAYFTVLDGENPQLWTPWGRAMSDISTYVKSVKTPQVPAAIQFSVEFDLILKTRAELLGKDTWYGVVGSVVDLKSADYSLRELHAKVCYKIASGDSLSSRIGYYIAFIVGGDPTAAEYQLMTDIEHDAAGALNLPSGVPIDSFEVSSVEVLGAALRQFEKQMRKASPKGH